MRKVNDPNSICQHCLHRHERKFGTILLMPPKDEPKQNGTADADYQPYIVRLSITSDGVT